MADTTLVRWGILGAARFAQEHMGPAIHMAHGAELAGLATSDPAKAVPFQAFAPRLRVFTDYDALLADPGIDAVYIPLPNTLHVEWTLKALAAGKHVLTEKPLAMKAGEFDEYAVLVGDFPAIDDPDLQKTLKELKYSRPVCLTRSSTTIRSTSRRGASSSSGRTPPAEPSFAPPRLPSSGPPLSSSRFQPNERERACGARTVPPL